MATLTNTVNNIIQKVNNLTSSKVNKVTSTDNAVVRFNGTTGEVQNSGVTIDDNGIVGIRGGNGEASNISAGLGINAVNAGNTILYNWLDNSSIDIWAGVTQKTGIHINGQTASGGSYVSINTGGAERVRIDSAGNVGMGVTPSGNYKIETSSDYTGSFRFGLLTGGNSGANYPSIGCNFRTTTTSNSYLYSFNNNASMVRFDSGGFQFFTAPTGTAGNPITWTNAMTLDANGNLGIGVTPRSWYPSYPNIDFGNLAIFGRPAGNNDAGIVKGAYLNSSNNWIKTDTLPTTLLSMANGTFRFNTAPSGTVGNPITWTNTMTLDASGNVGIGLTPDSNLGNIQSVLTGGRRFTKNIPISGANYKHKYLLLMPVPTFGNSNILVALSGKYIACRSNSAVFADVDFSLSIGYGNFISFSSKTNSLYKPELVQVIYNGVNYLALYWYTGPNAHYSSFDGILNENSTTRDANFLTHYETDTAVHSAITYTNIATKLNQGLELPNTPIAGNVLDWYEEGNATLTATGFTTTPTGTAYFTRVGNTCTMQIPDISGTSNSTSFTLSGIPSSFRPSGGQNVMVGCIDNGVVVTGRASISSSGVITFSKDMAGNVFTASGTKRVFIQTITYLV